MVKNACEMRILCYNKYSIVVKSVFTAQLYEKRIMLFVFRIYTINKY